MIGNDIIDLKLASKESNWERPGFLEKQFTEIEINLILESSNPFILVWRFWSMKEAAYKIVVQQQSKRFFAPKKFECQIISETEGLVRFEDQEFQSTTTITSNYIYTIIGNAQFQWIGVKTQKEELLKIIEKQIGVFEGELKIEKNAFGVPNIYHHGLQISSSFSKTHHGSFEAFECKL